VSEKTVASDVVMNKLNVLDECGGLIVVIIITIIIITIVIVIIIVQMSACRMALCCGMRGAVRTAVWASQSHKSSLMPLGVFTPSRQCIVDSI